MPSNVSPSASRSHWPRLNAPAWASSSARARSAAVAQHLPAAEDDDALEVAHRALVGHVEGGQPVDLVAEQVDAHRRVRGRGEHVDDAAAHRDLAAVLDLVLPAVAAADEAWRGVSACSSPLAATHHDRLGRLAPRPEALQDGPHRGATTTRSPGSWASGSSPNRRQSTSSRAPIVWVSGLTRSSGSVSHGENERHRALVEEAAQVIREPLGIGDGRGDDEQRAQFREMREAGEHEGPGGRGDGQRRVGAPEDPASGRVGAQQRRQRVQGPAGRSVSIVVTGGSGRGRLGVEPVHRGVDARGGDHLDRVGGLGGRRLERFAVALGAVGAARGPPPHRGGLPMPMRIRAKALVCRCASIERSPLWPASPPPSLTWIPPGGRSSSSWTTTRRSGSSDAEAPHERPDGVARLVHVGGRHGERDPLGRRCGPPRASRAGPSPGGADPCRAGARARRRRRHRRCGACRRTRRPGLPRPTTSRSAGVPRGRRLGGPPPREEPPQRASPRRRAGRSRLALGAGGALGGRARLALGGRALLALGHLDHLDPRRLADRDRDLGVDVDRHRIGQREVRHAERRTDRQARDVELDRVRDVGREGRAPAG